MTFMCSFLVNTHQDRLLSEETLKVGAMNNAHMMLVRCLEYIIGPNCGVTNLTVTLTYESGLTS